LPGVTAIDINAGCPTLSVVVFEIEPEVAVMVVLPTPPPEARPAELTVATVARDELHVTALVRSRVLLSL
jgi:hypothetical protein